MIKKYVSIILFFALSNITLTYAMEPKSLTNICLNKIYKNLNDNLSEQNFIDQLDALPQEITYTIKKMLIDSNIDKIWHIFSKEISKTALVGHKGRVNAIAISPDTNFIVSATNDHTACIWRAGNCIRLTGHNATVKCIAISSNNKFIATGSADGTGAVWNAQTGKCLAQLAGHTAGINSIDISPDNKFIVTGSSDSYGIKKQED